MTIAFKSERHEQIFVSVLAELRKLGYKGALLQEHYPFGDWFLPNRPQRVAPAAAFGLIPPSYTNACFAVLVPNGRSGASLVNEYRALGAPFALEVLEDRVNLWRVGSDERATRPSLHLTPERIAPAFKARADDWSADSILRAKNLPDSLRPRQLDFVDVGLIPALEEQIHEKLDTLLKDVLGKTKRVYRRKTGEEADEKRLFRLVFRLLAAKILHDRGAEGFVNLTLADGPTRVLRAVGQFYRQHEEVIDQADAQEAAMAMLWEGVNFQNLSVEALAYIYENTLVSQSSRKRLGTHSTPSSVARYLIHRLPFEDCPRDQRFVVEPCSGHAVLLIAAMQRLKELLPATADPAMRHQYLLRMLRGFEVDTFALEVGRLCLMLADFPNSNGWQLENKNVFASRSFTEALATARFVVCNPPFEDFAEEDRGRRGLSSLHRPAEVLYRVLENLHPKGALGFVLPRQFLDGKGYRDLREKLARRFRELELLALPDRVFHVSKAESALLVARSPSGDSDRTTVSFAEVSDRDRALFLRNHEVSRRDVRRRTVEEATRSLIVPPLWEVWQRLSGCRKLGSAAGPHRGIEWKRFDERFCYSQVSGSGYRPGFTKVRGDLLSYIPLRPEYLNVEPSNLRRRAIEQPWELPKVVVNAARISRGPWRLAAFVDREGNLCSQQFIGIWPRKEDFPVEVLTAVLNGPVANAFVASRERGRHNQIRTLKSVPLPELGEAEYARVADLVVEYQRIASRGFSDEQATRLRSLLVQIDTLILAGYGLPPRLERKVLDYFQGEQRPVSCDFSGYDIQTVALTRAVGGNGDLAERWEEKRQRRDQLAERLLNGTITSEEDAELGELDQAIDRFVDTVSPLPFDVLERLEAEARLQGVDTGGED